MSTLTAVLAHLRAKEVHERLELLTAVAPDAKFVVCYGGQRDEFREIERDDKLFIDDPTLRGPEQHLQSLTVTFTALWQAYFENDPALDSLYLIEYDHLIFDRDFEKRLADLALATGADLLGKNCVERTGTNDEHYVRFRRDQRLLTHLRHVSVREDPIRLFGCLGNGMWLSRRALQAYVETREHPPCYCETYVPTLVHHLGLRVVDIDAHSDMYRYVRWIPNFDTAEVLTRLRDGAPFMHPVKGRDAVRLAREALVGTAPPRGAESVARGAAAR